MSTNVSSGQERKSYHCPQSTVHERKTQALRAGCFCDSRSRAQNFHSALEKAFDSQGSIRERESLSSVRFREGARLLSNDCVALVFTVLVFGFMGALFSGDSVPLRSSEATVKIVTRSEECLEGACGLKEEKSRQECRRYQA